MDSLHAHNVQGRWSNAIFTYTHAKFMIVDNDLALIGTLNYPLAHSPAIGNLER